MVSRSSPPWPTSTAQAITSAPVFSAIQPIATEVSSPPEYASTTLSAAMLFPLVDVSACRHECVRARSPTAFGQPEQLRRQGVTARRVAGDDQDRVVAGHRAEDGRQGGVVD